MAAASIQIANPANLQKIESFFNDSSYREAIENSCTFNTRLCVERRQRMPFLDPQTGVAQNHCTLFMKKRQRMPGMREGQIYTYPAARWRKARRQYLTQQHRPFGIIREPGEIETEVNAVSNHENPELNNTDSKDSQNMKEEVPKEWFYDEQELLEMEGFEDPDPDSDYDYEESYSKRRRRRSGKGSRGGGGLATTDSPQTKRGRSSAGAGRGRRKAQPAPPYEVMGDADKPFGCELCGARYKTRPGLTYHYTHSHKEPMSDGDSRDSASAKTASGAPAVAGVQSGAAPAGTALAVPNPNAVTTPPTSGSGSPTPPSEVPSGVVASKVAPVAPATDAKGVDPKAGPSTEYQDSYVTFLNNPAGAPIRRGRPGPPSLPPNTGASPLSNPDDPTMPVLTPEQKIPESDSDTERPIPKGPAEKGKAAPSPYCDFCLGDHRENKKTMTPEELVSCSDCGRSGHPTCLQFTANMIISVRKYRWQCIECKCCSICGNSDNDDQLLFCDDCDRGYHMYCLAPPLATPPEGSWSCRLCIEEFHK